ncbi:glycosyltransferase family 2 protein [Salinimicrobium sediminilitoris]|uniref:glycosyltransferase family 2 protein n=1 Tax=Salinimicrobium sediminilitoris TaxID=2876715 RepID=UPI001E2873D4|nr:glycosyltransferase family 2 protein [Salinimicrobium sediminilitoris]MCC8358456.1 glycosyltransferase [Salinimicrobium sediminilitoris]
MSARLNSISVIIPNRNRKEIAANTIDNVLNQKINNLEVIVIDDHSEDGTFQFLEERFGNSIVLIKNKGRGPGAARNTGLKIAKGAYIKFFDSDDLMTCNTLEHQRNILDESGKGYIYSPYFHAFQNEKDNKWNVPNNVILSYFNTLKGHGLQDRMCNGLFICIPSMLFKREFLEKVGPWKEDVVAYEDWEYLWRISCLENYPAHTNDCAFLYRLHAAQTTSRNFSNKERDLQKLQTFSKIYKEHFENNQHLSRFQKSLFLTQMSRTWLIYKHDKAFEEFNFLKRDNLRVLAFLMRIKNKFGRLTTRNMWQPMHGTINSGKIVTNFLEKIN